MNISKYYKPEILICPKCGEKLVYRYAVSNKLIYFTSGKQMRIHNLGYGCPKCNDNNIYVSQTANKLAFKGYTYSAKIICLISKLKEQLKSRDEICDYFFTKNIEMSDRNVDNLYQKYLECININSKEVVPIAYKLMLDNYKEIRISIDLITITGSYFVIIYDYFSTKMLGMAKFDDFDDKMIEFLTIFINKDYDISVITTIRRESNFVPLLRKLCGTKTKFISFLKI